jgi:hypothetical protein
LVFVERVGVLLETVQSEPKVSKLEILSEPKAEEIPTERRSKTSGREFRFPMQENIQGKHSAKREAADTALILEPPRHNGGSGNHYENISGYFNRT